MNSRRMSYTDFKPFSSKPHTTHTHTWLVHASINVWTQGVCFHFYVWYICDGGIPAKDGHCFAHQIAHACRNCMYGIYVMVESPPKTSHCFAHQIAHENNYISEHKIICWAHNLYILQSNIPTASGHHGLFSSQRHHDIPAYNGGRPYHRLRVNVLSHIFTVSYPLITVHCICTNVIALLS